MREGDAHWVLMHEHPFSILKKEGFHIIMKRAALEWKKISLTTVKNDCMQDYGVQKKQVEE